MERCAVHMVDFMTTTAVELHDNLEALRFSYSTSIKSPLDATTARAPKANAALVNYSSESQDKVLKMMTHLDEEIVGLHSWSDFCFHAIASLVIVLVTWYSFFASQAFALLTWKDGRIRMNRMGDLQLLRVE